MPDNLTGSTDNVATIKNKIPDLNEIRDLQRWAGWPFRVASQQSPLSSNPHSKDRTKIRKSKHPDYSAVTITADCSVGIPAWPESVEIKAALTKIL